MGLRVPYLLDLIVGLLCCPLAFFLWRWAASLETLPARKTARIAVLLAMVCVSFGAALAVVRIASLFDSVLVTWVRCAGIVAAASLFYAFVCVGSMRRLKM
ncbi:MAG: hypothetical protein H7Y20_19330, partial [Bryobacteraceae bacterium]|nr:hypothetical protein [Bryobacteraceae bacterium]